MVYAYAIDQFKS